MAPCFYFGVCIISRQRKKSKSIYDSYYMSKIHNIIYASGKGLYAKVFIELVSQRLKQGLYNIYYHIYQEYYDLFRDYYMPIMIRLNNEIQRCCPGPKCDPLTETVSPVYLMHLTFSQTTSGSRNDGHPCSIDSLYQSVYLRISNRRKMNFEIDLRSFFWSNEQWLP